MRDIPVPWRLAGVAALYGWLAWLALRYFSVNGVVGIFWPASGLALAALLLGGRGYAWGLWVGVYLFDSLTGIPPLAALGGSLGTTAAALLGHWLLTRDGRFDLNLQTIGDYSRLVFQAAFLACGLSALMGAFSFSAFGPLSSDRFFPSLIRWWMGDALGVMLLTPLILIWRHRPEKWPDQKQWGEAALILGSTFLAGQVIFLGWLPDTVGKIVFLGYWMFLFVTWTAIRLGTRGVSVILCMTAVQSMLGIHFNTGFLAHTEETQLISSGFYLMILSLVGMSLAIYLTERRQAEATLRIAAIAFECQEGMIITDAQQRILRINQSFSRIMGYESEEAVGRTTAIMRSDRHEAAFYDAIWAESRRSGDWRGEIWHRRKNGEVFPQWVTSTGVKDEQGQITHFVVTHTDITYQKQQEAKRLAEEAAHRDALVREVHHRIKNNLQGITGMMRQFAQDHPETAEPINQAIGQVRSIAVIHGLQGRTSLQTVRLCELTSAIAGDIDALWQTPVRVDIPAVWTPGILAETEAVPIALVLNELILNAVKHGGKAHGDIEITLRKGEDPQAIRISITNTGRWQSVADRPGSSHSGLQLVDALLPQAGARLLKQQHDDKVTVLLELAPPVIALETKELA